MTQDQTTDVTADQMLNVLKGELAMETENQVNEAALIQQREMQFQDELKKLWDVTGTTEHKSEWFYSAFLYLYYENLYRGLEGIKSNID